MNLKLAKRLRRVAHRMMLDIHLADPKNFPVLDRKLMILQAHVARAEKGDTRVTAVNHPQSTRGIYRWLKRNHAKTIP